MNDPITVTTPDGHVTITAHPWNADERPQVIAGLAQIVDSLHRAFPELRGIGTIGAPALDLLPAAIDEADEVEAALQIGGDDEIADARLAQSDCDEQLAALSRTAVLPRLSSRFTTGPRRNRQPQHLYRETNDHDPRRPLQLVSAPPHPHPRTPLACLHHPNPAHSVLWMTETARRRFAFAGSGFVATAIAFVAIFVGFAVGIAGLASLITVLASWIGLASAAAIFAVAGFAVIGSMAWRWSRA